VVHFWASWCPECKEELPVLERAIRDCSKEKGVRIMVVNVGESTDEARRFLEREGSALPLLRDPEGAVWRTLARGLPANVLWTREGRRTDVGPKSPAAWRSLFQGLGCQATPTR
jgi:thiol-disulfide isomerase/thioredoxin